MQRMKFVRMFVCVREQQEIGCNTPDVLSDSDTHTCQTRLKTIPGAIKIHDDTTSSMSYVLAGHFALQPLCLMSPSPPPPLN